MRRRTLLLSITAAGIAGAEPSDGCQSGVASVICWLLQKPAAQRKKMISTMGSTRQVRDTR